MCGALMWGVYHGYVIVHCGNDCNQLVLQLATGVCIAL